MTAKDYPVTFPYDATTPPYSENHPHTGEDRKCPIGTPVEVNGQKIGETGNTGKTTGPHIHIQLVKNDEVQNPSGNGFFLLEPAVVIEAGEKIDIGKYIRIRDGSGAVWSYFHLSKVLVNKDDIIGDDMNEELAASIAKWGRLLGFNSEEKMYAAQADDIAHIMADPMYAARLLEQLYKGEWQNPAYKALNYDKDVQSAYERGVEEGKAEAGKIKTVPLSELMVVLPE